MDIKKWLFQNKIARIWTSSIVDRFCSNLGPCHLSYSLEGEDMFLRAFFKGKKNGFYVDVGANDPYKQSNTAYFYLRGWTGINIDASREAVNILKSYRKNDKNLRALISNETKSKRVYKFNESALNTVSKKLANEYANLPGYSIIKSETLKPVSLKSVLNRFTKRDTVIDFMTIDVEGHELNVLKSNDWKRYRPRVIVVEVLDVPTLAEVNHSKTYQYLSKLGYECFAKTSTNLLMRDSLHK